MRLIIKEGSVIGNITDKGLKVYTATINGGSYEDTYQALKLGSSSQAVRDEYLTKGILNPENIEEGILDIILGKDNYKIQNYESIL